WREKYLFRDSLVCWSQAAIYVSNLFRGERSFGDTQFSHGAPENRRCGRIRFVVGSYPAHASFIYLKWFLLMLPERRMICCGRSPVIEKLLDSQAAIFAFNFSDERTRVGLCPRWSALIRVTATGWCFFP